MMLSLSRAVIMVEYNTITAAKIAGSSFPASVILWNVFFASTGLTSVHRRGVEM